MKDKLKKITYKKYIQNIIDNRGQWNILDNRYYEMHHILPACLGGDGDYIGSNGRNCFKKNSKHINCIYLYPEEHYEAHRLLALENPNNKSLVYSFWAMCTLNKNNKQYHISAKDYAKLKKLWLKLDHSLSEEHKNKLRKFNLGKSHPNRWKKVICIETQEIFESVMAANKSANTNWGVSSVLHRRNGTASGYHWAYLDDKELQNKYIKYKGINKKTTGRGKTCRKAVICIETQEVFESIIEVYRLKKLSVGRCAYDKSIVRTAGGYHWAFLDDSNRIAELSCYKNKEPIVLHKKRVLCIELNKIFDSIANANIYFNKRVTNVQITRACKDANKLAYGYHWKFI